jgi:hypothetical protein
MNKVLQVLMFATVKRATDWKVKIRLSEPWDSFASKNGRPVGSIQSNNECTGVTGMKRDVKEPRRLGLSVQFQKC